MTHAKFVIQGDPVSKSRARVTKHGTFTPQRTANAEVIAKWAWLNAIKSGPPALPGCAWSLNLTLYRWNRRHQDVDNMAKLVMDALNGVAWEDDYQVEDLTVSTVWVFRQGDARTEAVVYSHEHPAAPSRGA